MPLFPGTTSLSVLKNPERRDSLFLLEFKSPTERSNPVVEGHNNYLFVDDVIRSIQTAIIEHE
jgi:hypothetical protein